jgi:hypothetical protein
MPPLFASRHYFSPRYFHFRHAAISLLPLRWLARLRQLFFRCSRRRRCRHIAAGQLFAIDISKITPRCRQPPMRHIAVLLSLISPTAPPPPSYADLRRVIDTRSFRMITRCASLALPPLPPGFLRWLPPERAEPDIFRCRHCRCAADAAFAFDILRSSLFSFIFAAIFSPARYFAAEA